MAARNEDEGGFGVFIPTERYIRGDGSSRTRGVVIGEGQARDDLEEHLLRTYDGHFVSPKEEQLSRKLFSGHGDGHMDASQGRRTKLVYKRGTGWTSAN